MTDLPQPQLLPEGPGKTAVGTPSALLAAAILVALAALSMYALVDFWPHDAAVAQNGSIPFFAWSISPSVDAQLFLVVIAAGFIGGLVHSLRSLYWYVGNRNLRRSWLYMIFLLPPVGAAMALIVYLVLRGGLLAGQTTSGQVNVFGFTAVGALVGLFSPQAILKLREVFNTLLTPGEKGGDNTPPK